MADPDDPAEAAARLEQALERIAALATRPQVGQAPAAASLETEPPSVDATEVATRLDALIAKLRSALAPRSED